MRRAIAVVAVAVGAVGFEANAASDDATIYTRQIAAYSDESSIPKAVVAECRLPQRQAELIEQAAKESGLNVVRDDSAVAAGKGRILVVEISDTISSGNAFLGHQKLVKVKGRLLEDGSEVGSFSGQRSSMGGAFAGFKGSCSVLERCLSTLARDISIWLKNPARNARIGE